MDSVVYGCTDGSIPIHTHNSPEMTHLSVWIPSDNNTIRAGSRVRVHAREFFAKSLA